MTQPQEQQREPNELGRAVFRAILFGADELAVITPPPLPGRTCLDDPTMLAQRTRRKRLVPLQHAEGQPIRVPRLANAEENRGLAKLVKKIRRQELRALAQHITSGAAQ
jgi:hypothetical protein